MSYNIPVGAHLAVQSGTKIKAGQILVKIPRTMGKSRDITGGLPRVTELFEARNPSNPAVVSEIDGVVTYGGIKRGNREIQHRIQRWRREKIPSAIVKTYIWFRTMTLYEQEWHCPMEQLHLLIFWQLKVQLRFRNTL